MITSESPAIQIRSLCFGVNAVLRGCAGVSGLVEVAGLAGDGVVPDDLTGAVGWTGVDGSAIFVSISSSPERPIAAWTPFRGPVEQQRVAQARERAGQRERDVALPAGWPVVGGLVGPRRVEQETDRERQHADDERVPGAPLPP